MNAWTSPDHTTYPFATTNAQDFRNLMSVYLDATLHPLLKEHDFTQEGWRIGPTNPVASLSGNASAEDNRLVFKGVVYNEMKGQMSDAGYLYYIRFNEHLIPALNNSGGDPQRITDLTHGKLKNFHAEHYHPSNAKVFTYGDMPLEEHLQDIGKRLDRFDRITVDEDIKSPVDFSSGPQFIAEKGPIDPLVPADAQYKTSVTWKMGSSADTVEKFSSGVLSSLLLNGYGAPVYQALIESGLGADFTSNTGYNTLGNEGVFSVGLTGVKQENVTTVRKTLFDVFAKAKHDGFDKIKIDGILHQLELALKHKSTQFGMTIMSRIQEDWHNGLDPFDTLAWEKTVGAFKMRYAQPGYLEGLVEKYLLSDNTLTFTMEPSSTYAQEVADEEATRLASKILETTKQFPSEEEAQQYLTQRELELLKEQEQATHEDLSSLPRVHIEDIPRQKPKKEVRFSESGNVKVQWRETPTNGLTYLRAKHVLKDLPDELRELIPLFSASIMRLGTKNLSVEQLENLMKLKTGGISLGFHSATSPTNLSDCEEGILLSGHAFDRNVPDMFNLIRILVTETDFDNPEAEKKILQLLQTSSNGAVDDIAGSGHAYARRYALAGITPEGRLQEQVAGLTQVALTASLAAKSEPGALRDVVEKLKVIQQMAILASADMRVALTCGPESSRANEDRLAGFLQSLPAKIAQRSATGSNSTLARNAKTFFPLPYQVYYSGVAVPTVPYVNPDSAPLQILGELLTHKHLHHEIREKGGAYGAGASSLGLQGAFGFISYRDPNPQNSLRIIKESGAWARDRTWTDDDIEGAKLGVFQSIDAPESVNSEGMARFLYGITPEMQQRRREQLLDVTPEQVNEVAQKYLVEGIDGASTAVLGEQKDWVKEQDGWQIKHLGPLEEKVEEVLLHQERGAAVA
jgi:presequence protease